MSMPTAISQAQRCEAGLWRAAAESRCVDVHVWGAGLAGRTGVQRDAVAALRAIKPDGLLLFNVYTPYSPIELGYHDVVLGRRQ
jgi:hypothetical protein